MKTSFEILNKLASYKTYLKDKYSISSLAIFGSVSRGDNSESSDIDIMVEFEKPIGISFIDLADELEKILQNKIDLVSRKSIKPKYFDAIKSDLKYV